MKIGISRGCGGSAEGARELLALAREAGFEGVQVKTDLVRLFGFDAKAFAEACGELADLAAGGVVFHPSRDPADWPAELSRVMRFAAAAGAEHLCICSAVAREGGDEQFPEVARALMEMGRLAKDAGLAFSVHNHADCLFETADDLRKLSAGLDPEVCGLTFDTAHADKGGMTDLGSAVREFRPFITNVHLKDRAADGSFCPLGRGVMDLEPALDALRETGYDRWLVVDEESKGISAEEACRVSMEYLRSRGAAPAGAP